MKKNISLLALFLSLLLPARSYPITAITISLPANPDAVMAVKNEDIVKPITFRWTLGGSRPKEPITYRLKVWQLMQGQTGAQAMKSNQPIITKDVDMPEFTVPALLSGPSKPPLISDFVWSVQALDRSGKPIAGTKVPLGTGRFAVRK